MSASLGCQAHDGQQPLDPLAVQHLGPKIRDIRVAQLLHDFGPFAHGQLLNPKQPGMEMPDLPHTSSCLDSSRRTGICLEPRLEGKAPVLRHLDQAQ